MSPLELVAYAPDERWAFVRIGVETFRLREPSPERAPVTESEIERAVTVGGWVTGAGLVFNGSEELFKFLRAESVRVWRAAHPPADPDALRDLLRSRAEADPRPRG